MPTEQILLFLFGALSLFMYTLIVITIKRQRANALLGGSFFRIVEMQYYAELVFFLEFSVTMRFRKYTNLYAFFEPGTEFHTFVPRLLSGIHYYIKIVVYIGYITFAINRLTSAVRISSQGGMNASTWSSERLLKIQIAQWIIPLFFVIPTHTWPDFLFWFQVTDSSIRLMGDPVSTNLVAYIDGSCCIATCLFCMVCYVITGIVIRKNWKRISRDRSIKKTAAQAAAERGLFISSIISFVVLTFNTIMQSLTIFIEETADILVIQDLSYPMIDLMYSHYPWALLITSSVLRKQMIYDGKIFLRKLLNLDDASVVRIGATTITPGTRRTISTQHHHF